MPEDENLIDMPDPDIKIGADGEPIDSCIEIRCQVKVHKSLCYESLSEVKEDCIHCLACCIFVLCFPCIITLVYCQDKPNKY